MQLAKCHINGDSNVFIEFMLKQIDKILEEILLRADEQDEHVTEYVKKFIECYGIRSAIYKHCFDGKTRT